MERDSKISCFIAFLSISVSPFDVFGRKKQTPLYDACQLHTAPYTGLLLFRKEQKLQFCLSLNLLSAKIVMVDIIVENSKSKII